MELKVENLCKKYAEKTALEGLSFCLSEGIYGLLGPNVPRYELKTAFII